MQFPNISIPLFFWVIAGIASIVLGVLTRALEEPLDNLIRRIFKIKRSTGRPHSLWLAWLIAAVIFIIGSGIAGLSQVVSHPEGDAENTPLPSTKIFSSPAGENLAPNPSFEQGALQPAGWLPINSQNAEYTWNPALAHTGNHSLCIDRVDENVSAEWDTSIWIPVDAGRSYHFSIWARGNGDREVYIGIYPLDAKKSWLTGYAMRLSMNPTTWTKTEGDYAIPYMGSFVVLAVEVNNPQGVTNDSICFDDITFEPIDPSS